MIDLEALAADVGTPMYVYDLAETHRSATLLRSFLPAPSQLYYSVKANPHPEVVGALRRVGCRAEISSFGELQAVMEAGFSARDLLYTGPAKSKEEVSAALHAGVRLFSTESPEDYRRIAAATHQSKLQADILLRIAGGARTGGGLRMTGRSSQFGHPLAALLTEPTDFSPTSGASLAGLHFFSVSSAADEGSLISEFAAAIETATEVAERLRIQLRMVDLGGGFAAPYAIQTAPDAYPKLKRELESLLDAQLSGWRRREPSILFESGRRLTASCGVLVATVMDVKFSGNVRYVLLDTGINHLGGLAGTGRMMKPTASVTVLGSAGRSAFSGRTVVAGPLCTPADILTYDAELPDVKPGDLVSVPSVGAYGLSASLVGFLSRPLPAEVVIDLSGAVHVSRVRLDREPISIEGSHEGA